MPQPAYHDFRGSGHRVGVGTESPNVFVLISDQLVVAFALDLYWYSSCLHPLSIRYRINKKGSQKDSEQKKNGNYFFYDDGDDDDDDDDFDDL